MRKRVLKKRIMNKETLLRKAKLFFKLNPEKFKEDYNCQSCYFKNSTPRMLLNGKRVCFHLWKHLRIMRKNNEIAYKTDYITLSDEYPICIAFLIQPPKKP